MILFIIIILLYIYIYLLEDLFLCLLNLQYFTRSGLRVSVVHLARSNAGVDEELYDHVCLETTAQKVADNQYRLSYVYKSISGL